MMLIISRPHLSVIEVGWTTPPQENWSEHQAASAGWHISPGRVQVDIIHVELDSISGIPNEAVLVELTLNRLNEGNIGRN